jgi:phage-related protein
MNGKSLMVLAGEIKTPPMSEAARRETGFLLRRLQQGEKLGLPHSRPMPDIGPRCHELRVNDRNKTWRVIYRIDDDAIIVAEVIEKKTRATSRRVMDNCQRRLRLYDEAAGD